jgi:hypothetical protein
MAIRRRRNNIEVKINGGKLIKYMINYYLLY